MAEKPSKSNFLLLTYYERQAVLVVHHINSDGLYFSPIYRTFAIRQGITFPGGLDTQPAKLMK